MYSPPIESFSIVMRRMTDFESVDLLKNVMRTIKKLLLIELLKIEYKSIQVKQHNKHICSNITPLVFGHRPVAKWYRIHIKSNSRAECGDFLRNSKKSTNRKYSSFWNVRETIIFESKFMCLSFDRQSLVEFGLRNIVMHSDSILCANNVNNIRSWTR